MSLANIMANLLSVKMTRKHFREVAKIINSIPYLNRAEVCLTFAYYFEQHYPNFNRKKFCEACGLYEREI
jgi:endonuclease IV